MTDLERQPETPKSRTPRFNWMLFNRLAKVFVVLLTLAIGLSVVLPLWFPWFPWFEFAGDGEQPSQTGLSARSDMDNQLEALDSLDGQLDIFHDFTSGNWRFGADQWSYRVTKERSLEDLRSPPTSLRSASPQFDDQSVLASFREQGIEPQSIAEGLEVWEWNAAGFAMVLITREGVVQVLRSRLPVDQGFSVIEGVPRTSDGSATEQLLPLVDGATQSAVRVDDQGQVTSAIIELNRVNQVDILSHWNEDGWNVSPLPAMSQLEEFASARSNRFRCTRGKTTIDATFLTSETGDSISIVLNRLPTTAKEPRP